MFEIQKNPRFREKILSPLQRTFLPVFSQKVGDAYPKSMEPLLASCFLSQAEWMAHHILDSKLKREPFNIAPPEPKETFIHLYTILYQFFFQYCETVEVQAIIYTTIKEGIDNQQRSNKSVERSGSLYAISLK
uniref:Uncharacterized protein n=1 Tax=Timema bartmani TaxID=61472 RepID=A0A7R9I554_9NEOP|nr:unnamed protein product [Timema bartmani]